MYKTFKAILQEGKKPEFIADIHADSVKSVKKQLEEQHNINPFYVIIVNTETETIEYNKHVSIKYYQLKKYYFNAE